MAGAHGPQVSGRGTPAMHLGVAASTPHLRHLELFADHERLEAMLFDGVPFAVGGSLALPDGPGIGFALSARAEEFRI